MRVLFVSQEYPPETGWGGIGTYVGILAEALSARGADVHVLSSVPGQATATTNDGGVTVHRLSQIRVPGVGRATHLPETTRRLWTAMAALRRSNIANPDVIEAPEWQAEGLGLALRNRAPLVVRLHSAARQLFPYTGQGRGLRGLDGTLTARLEELSIRRAVLVTGTRSALDEMRPHLRLAEAQTRTIGIPVRLPEPPVRAERSGQVLFVGRLEPRKAPEVLLHAVPAILAQVPDATFAFAGADGVQAGAPASSAWLRAEARRLGVDHAVRFLGPLSSEAVQREMRLAAVCAAPSRWESFGYVVAEAGAAGTPVVTSDIAAFADLVDNGRTGLRLGSEAPEQWAQSIVALLTDRARARAMGMRATQHVRALCDPLIIADATLTAYREAIERFESRKPQRRRR